MEKMISLVTSIRNFCIWMMPFAFFLLFLFLILKFLNSANLDNYIEFLKVLVWPVTVLSVLFFFRKVVTYMFFSMNKFNFFGADGDLKNVHDLIQEEVEKRFIQEKESSKNKEELLRLENEIKVKDDQLGEKSAAELDNLNLARSLLKNYRDYKKDTDRTLASLQQENSELKQRSSASTFTDNSIPADDLSGTNKTL